jgi:hypothetical protein
MQGCSRYFRRVKPKHQSKERMTKASSVIKKVEVINQNNSKPPQFNGKRGDDYFMWNMKFKADMVMKGLWDAFLASFKQELPAKESVPFNLDTDEGKKQQKAVKMNQKAIMQFTLSFTKVGLMNKINCEQLKDKVNWPTGKAYSVTQVILKEYEPEDTMAEMEMEAALEKMKLDPKKDPNNLNDELAAIECKFSIEMSNSKKKAQVLRLGGVNYAGVIATTQMIYREKGKELQASTLLEEMHIQWHLAGGVTKEKATSVNDDEELAVVARHTVLKFCLQFVLQNVLIISCFPAYSCCA